ncbi:transporter substrate-binding domain-containing protein [Actinosynnema pretiosum subsp. pretiosum]|uniref:Extracellular solute-binding protein family 3 n=3 Tax=Actinosynnema TaxID=40566 RepID=C6WSA9_ACTMD|nr:MULTISPECIES: transporter substrate-binding domain-containing protein [Actinosynnema]ACU40779.1 extracellular solute-binding protein family 3 [Actinosynnema mirum DSM 43827]ATE57798.1 ABC transporter substrate-binding protein [Actinosynnema pretiosum]AXX34286.1 Dipeptide-binding ABC transporter, periplasmic substrate-binding component [Actinosynnema pretiosum subsp. pretiosum]QUF02005.1 transporter substrate-binding domain-containing protein [Actinosynnema pretiosum subsp. pretiosum]
MTRRSRHAVRALLPVLALAATATGCATKVDTSTGGGNEISLVQEGKLVTCTHMSYEPFQFTQNGETVGFDVDLVNLVAKELGVTQQIFDTPFENITSGTVFSTGECDLAAAGITITEKRKEAIDFSDPYFDASQALLVKKDSGLKDLASLKGKVLGVQQGTTGEEYGNANAQANGYEVKQFEDLPLLETAVRTGSIDAAINDNGVLFDYAKKFPETEVTAEFDTGEQYGIALKKGNTALNAKIGEVIKKAKESGEYDTIYEKWFGKKPSSN